MKKYYLFMFIFLCLFIQAAGVIAPPRVETQFLEVGQTITVETPQYLDYNKSLSLHWWVYNTTDGKVLTNATTTCSLYLMNNTGNIFLRVTSYEEKLINYGGYPTPLCRNCFHVIIDKGNFSVPGVYSYHIKCNSTLIGGFVLKEFYVTKNNRTYNGYIQEDGLIIGLFIILFVVIVSLLIFTVVDMIAHVFSLDYDALDVGKSFGLYSMVLAVYAANNYYLGSTLIEQWFLLFIQIGIWTHVIIPLFNFAIMLVAGQFIKQRIHKTT